MEKKLALLASLNEAYFSLTDNDGDIVYFMGDAAEKSAEYEAEMSEQYDDYFKLCNNGDDQTVQIPVSLDEWKEKNEKTFYNWCDDNCDFVGEEVEAETRKSCETHYYKFQSKRYLVCLENEIKTHYDERCLQMINEFHVENETKRDSWLRGFCENHEAELIKWFQRDSENQESRILVEDGKLYDYKEVDGTYYTIFEQ